MSYRTGERQPLLSNAAAISRELDLEHLRARRGPQRQSSSAASPAQAARGGPRPGDIAGLTAMPKSDDRSRDLNLQEVAENFQETAEKAEEVADKAAAKVTNWVAEWQEFMATTGVTSFGVGAVLGGLYVGILSSLVSDILMPPMNLLWGKSLMEFYVVLRGGKHGPPYESIEQAWADGAITENYGKFVLQIINVIAFTLILGGIVAVHMRMQRRYATKADNFMSCPQCARPIPPEAKRCPFCTSFTHGDPLNGGYGGAGPVTRDLNLDEVAADIQVVAEKVGKAADMTARKVTTWVNEWEEFMATTGVTSFGVGVVLGGLYIGVLSSFVNDLLMPPMNLLWGKSLIEFYVVLRNGKHGPPYESIHDAWADGAITENYGQFILQLINVFVFTLILGGIVAVHMRFQRRYAAQADNFLSCPQCARPIPPEARRCPFCTSFTRGDPLTGN